MDQIIDLAASGGVILLAVNFAVSYFALQFVVVITESMEFSFLILKEILWR